MKRLREIELAALPAGTHVERITSVPLAAQSLGVHVETLYQAIHSGRLPAYRSEDLGLVVLRKANLDAFAKHLRPNSRRGQGSASANGQNNKGGTDGRAGSGETMDFNKTEAGDVKVEFVEGLEGLYFHTFHPNGEYNAQGRVVKRLNEVHYSVLLYDADGEPNYSQVAHVDDMRQGGWRFYDNHQQWIAAANRMIARMSVADYKAPGTRQSLVPQV